MLFFKIIDTLLLWYLLSQIFPSNIKVHYVIWWNTSKEFVANIFNFLKNFFHAENASFKIAHWIASYRWRMCYRNTMIYPYYQIIKLICIIKKKIDRNTLNNFEMKTVMIHIFMNFYCVDCIDLQFYQCFRK